MPELVQARCPHCRSILRIPAAWVSQPMRCKHCGQVFQARSKPLNIEQPAAATVAVTAAPAPPPLPSAVSTAVSAAPPPAAPSPYVQPGMPVPLGPHANGEPFAFDDQLDAGPIGRQPTRWWVGALVAGVVLSVAVVIAIIAGPQIAELFSGGSKDGAGQDQSGDLTRLLDRGVADQIAPDKLHIDKLRPFDKFPAPDKIFDKVPPPRDKPGADKPTTDSATDKAAVDKPATDKKVVPMPRDGPFPRRALLISVCNYLYANPLHYGTGADDAKLVRQGAGYPGSSTRMLKFLMEYSPLNLHNSQLAELTDGRYDYRGKEPATPTAAPFKRNIERAITEFLNTARAQDRIILLFAGHAVDIDKESYLVPLEGELGKADTLIPLSWVYDQLGKCRAQEKLFIVDLCRFPPDRGFELPGGGEPETGKMTEQLDAALGKPPAGVQVWTSCIKNQNSIELERGSVFLRSLCSALQATPRPITEPDQALPVSFLVNSVNERMQQVLAPQKFEQVSRLSGEPGKDGGYDPAQALAPAVTLKSIAPEGGGLASLEMIRSIKEEIDLIPPARQTRKPPDYLPPFPAKKMALYERDYKSLDDLKRLLNAEPDKYPVRAVVLEAIDVLNATDRIPFKERLGGSGPVDKKTKELFLRDQQAPGQSIFELERLLPRLIAAGDKLDQEASKRWHAHYHYTLARFQSRIIYLYEYNYILAQVRGDQLPQIDPAIHSGWRVGSKSKVSIAEPKVRDMVKNVGRAWKSIAEEYAETPWAVLAAREKLTALGLEWRPSRD